MSAITPRAARSASTRLLVATVATATVCTYCVGLQAPPVRSSAAIVDTATIVDSASTIGVADSDLYGESVADIDTTLDTLESIGVTSVRVFVPWALIEPAEGVYNWTYIDEVVAAAAARNMSVLAGVTSTPTWDAPGGTLAGAGTPNPTDYAAFLTQVAERYGTEISAYEIWNEPNYIASYDPIDPASYTALLKAGYTAIKAVDPSATVIAAGLGSVISFGSLTLDPITFVQEMLADGASGYFDAIAFHPYETSLEFSAGAGVADSPLTQIEAIEALLVAAGDPTKIWLTEYGVQTSEVSQQTQASFIQNLIDAWETLTYAGPVYIYTAQDGVDGTYGIYEADWTPKLAVAVLAAEIAKYATTVGSTVTTTITSPITAAVQQMAAFVQSVNKVLATMGQRITASMTAASLALAQLGRQLSHAITTAVATLTAALTKTTTTTSMTTTTSNAATTPTALTVDRALALTASAATSADSTTSTTTTRTAAGTAAAATADASTTAATATLTTASAVALPTAASSSVSLTDPATATTVTSLTTPNPDAPTANTATAKSASTTTKKPARPASTVDRTAPVSAADTTATSKSTDSGSASASPTAVKRAGKHRLPAGHVAHTATSASARAKA